MIRKARQQTISVLVISAFALGVSWADEDLRSANETKGMAMTGDTSEYDYVVSFISVGAGIEEAVHDRFTAYLETLAHQVSYRVVPWGMEGEVDYCIQINDSGEGEREAIGTKFTELLSQGKLSTLASNTRCPHL